MDSYSAGQAIHRNLFMESEGSLPYSQSPPLDPNQSQWNPVHTLTTCSPRSSIIVSSQQNLGLLSGLSHGVFRPRFCCISHLPTACSSPTPWSRTALGHTQPPIQWVPEARSLGVKRPWREAYRSPPSSAEVKELVEPYPHSPNTPSWRGAQLKHRDDFTFIFTF